MNKMKPNETQYCYSVYILRFNLQEAQRNFLLSYTIIVNGVITFILNTLLILVLVKTKQTNTHALKVLLYLSMLDVCVSLTAPTVLTVLLREYSSVRSCPIELLGQFLNVFFGHMSGLLASIIAYDRYARVRYLIQYPLVMSRSKINYLVLAATIISLFTGLMYTFGAIYGIYDLLSFVVFILYSGFILFTSVIYILTKRIVRKHRKSVTPATDRMEGVDKTITLLSKLVLLSLLLSYGPYTLTSTSNIYFYGYAETRRERSWFEFFLFFGMIIALTNSAMNAVIFLVINKKAHVFLKNLFCKKQERQAINQINDAVTTVSSPCFETKVIV